MFKTLLFSVLLCISAVAAKASDDVPLYTVYEVSFQGSSFKTRDTPAADVELVTTWQHESGNPIYKIYGFYDGDGRVLHVMGYSPAAATDTKYPSAKQGLSAMICKGREEKKMLNVKSLT